MPAGSHTTRIVSSSHAAMIAGEAGLSTAATTASSIFRLAGVHRCAVRFLGEGDLERCRRVVDSAANKRGSKTTFSARSRSRSNAAMPRRMKCGVQLIRPKGRHGRHFWDRGIGDLGSGLTVSDATKGHPISDTVPSLNR